MLYSEQPVPAAAGYSLCRNTANGNKKYFHYFMSSGSCQQREESADQRNLGRHQCVRTSEKTWHRGHIFVEQFALALLDKFYISHAIHNPTAAVLIGAVATQMRCLVWAITNVNEDYRLFWKKMQQLFCRLWGPPAPTLILVILLSIYLKIKRNGKANLWKDQLKLSRENCLPNDDALHCYNGRPSCHAASDCVTGCHSQMLICKARTKWHSTGDSESSRHQTKAVLCMYLKRWRGDRISLLSLRW